MKTLLRISSLLLLYATLPVAGAPRDSAQQIVDRAIAYHGGDLYRSSETSMVIESKSGRFGLTSKVDQGLFDHRVTRIRDGKEQVVRLTNDGVELTRDGVTEQLRGETAERLTRFVNERVYFPFLPFRLNDPGVIKADLGIETWDGRPLHKIKVTFEGAADDGDEYLYWFDPGTARLEMFAYSFQNNDGGLRLRKAFNFRRIGGILFYDSENFGISGKDHRVDEITAEFAGSKMEKISTVVVSDVRVRRLR